MKLAKLNPFGSLFGRIFIWFWLTLIIIIAVGFVIGRQVEIEGQLTIVPNRHKHEIEKIVQILEAPSRDGSNVITQSHIKRRLKHISNRRNAPSLLVEKSTGDMIYGFKHSRRLPVDRFSELLNENSAYGFKLGDLIFFGPTTTTINGKDYALFVGKPLTPSLMRRLYRRNPLLLIPFALVISGVLCFWLSWTLVKPLRELQQSTKRMAKGDLSVSVGSAAERSDEIGKLSRDFNYMSSQVSELVQGQKRLLGDISHELRSPLARLILAIGIAQQSREEGKPSDTDHLQRIEKEAHQIEQMIENVLKLSRAQSSAHFIDKQPLELTELVQHCIDDARFEAQTLNKTVTYEHPETIQLEADTALLTSAIENLVRNAIKYAESDIIVQLDRDEQHAVVRVIDDGPGVNEAELSAIFRPFYRLSEARSRDSGGVGLGLAIAHQAILANDGSIEARNNKQNSGLEVLIKLPYSDIKKDC